MKRITEKHLNLLVDAINKATNSPSAPYSHQGDGLYVANVGNYHLSFAYGGVSLHKMANDKGGVNDVFGCGHIPKRDLYNRMKSFLDALSLK